MTIMRSQGQVQSASSAGAGTGTLATSSSTTITSSPPLQAANTTTTEDHHLTIVIKLGSSSIINEDDFQPQLALLSSIVETICNLRSKGHRVVLVSSGAIAMGLKRMDMRKKPKVLAEKQALAAIGQGRLIAMWDNLFSMLGQPIAQVLLTRSDISDRSRYLNSTKTLSALLSNGVVPIVNENDTVSVSEIKFGDNDSLSAITASMIGANYLFLLTDVDCLYTDNPRNFPKIAKPIKIVRDIEIIRQIVSTSTMGSNLGTGGMETKIIAAELATGAGVSTVITHGKKPLNILAIVNNPLTVGIGGAEAGAGISDEEYENSTPLHTLFLPQPNPLPDKKWWVLHGLKPRGRIIIDEGAYKAIARSTVHPSTTRTSSGTQTPSLSNSTSIPAIDAAASPSNSIITSTSSHTPTKTTSAIPSPSILAGTDASRPFNMRATSSSASASALASASTSASTSTSSGNGGRLLPAGVIAVEGTFAAGQAVTIVVQRKRRRSKNDTNINGRNSGSIPSSRTQSSRAKRASPSASASSSLANSLILEQAKETVENASEAASALSHAVANQLLHKNNASSGVGSSSKSKSGSGSGSGHGNGKVDLLQSDSEHLDTTTDDETDYIEVEEQIDFGRGLANYNYQEIDKIKGHKSSEIEKILGYIESEHCVESITSLKRLEL